MANITGTNMNWQPCWTCKHSINGCEWSRNLEPVPGWKAEPVYKPNLLGEDELYSYMIIDCPKYEKEGKRKYAISDDKLRDFVFAIYAQSVEAWVVEYKDYKRHERKYNAMSLSCDKSEEKRAMAHAKARMADIEVLLPEWCKDALQRKAKEGLYDDE